MDIPPAWQPFAHQILRPIPIGPVVLTGGEPMIIAFVASAIVVTVGIAVALHLTRRW